MENTLDKTTLSTIDLLEARLLRLEHLIYGPAGPPNQPPKKPALSSVTELERRFQRILNDVRAYSDILKIYRVYPTLFTSPTQTNQQGQNETLPPTQLNASAVRATVLASASSFPATASALEAVTRDFPIPDPALSASLVSAVEPRARRVEAVQMSQAAEVAELRRRSERVVRAWYEGRVLSYGRFVADVESRVDRVEVGIRRVEATRADQEKV